MMRKVWLYLIAAILLMAAEAHAQPNYVLFYGNSFTMGIGSTMSVDALFSQIAVAAGREQPVVQSAAVSGQSLHWHLNNNIDAISTPLSPDFNWDYIVMQEYSTKLTRAFNGEPSFPESIEASQADAVELYRLATVRSPHVVPVLYETWARGPGHEFFTGNNPQYTDPHDMQAEVRAGYDLLQSAIDESAGRDVTLIAPVGDAWANANFDQLHANDKWHAQNRGTLLAALVIYGTLYRDASTSNIDLSRVLASLDLTSADGELLTTIADRTLALEFGPSSARRAENSRDCAACLPIRRSCGNCTQSQNRVCIWGRHVRGNCRR